MRWWQVPRFGAPSAAGYCPLVLAETNGRVTAARKVRIKMAGRIVGLVFEHYHGDALAKLVFLALADRANHEAVCWPSVADICLRSGASRATVTRKLRDLRRLGWIGTRQRFQDSAVFRINVARLLDCAEMAERFKPVPVGFEPFREELARAARQVIENKDKAHSEPQKAHSEPQKAQLGEPLTCNNLTITSPRGDRPKGAVPAAGREDAERAKRVAASRALVLRVGAERAGRGQDWQDFDGVWRGAADFAQFEAALGAENGASGKAVRHV